MAKINDRKLVLASGEEFAGRGFGGRKAQVCELAFSTTMFAAQDTICDPASAGLMLLMTYPVIGSVGITCEKDECRPYIGGLVVREYNDAPSNFRSKGTLGELLAAYDIPGIEGVDTRRLTRLLRDGGSRLAVIVDKDTPTADALAMIAAYKPGNLVAAVTRRDRAVFGAGIPVVLLDCGAKQSIIDTLVSLGCEVTVLPYDEAADAVAARKPQGLVVAGGPGSLEDLAPTADTLRALAGRFPILGIGTGLSLIAAARGAKAARLPAGQRGGNRPMRWTEGGAVCVSDRACAYAPDEASLTAAGLTVMCKDVIDGTVTAAADRAARLYGTLHRPDGDDRLLAEFIEKAKEAAENA